MNQREVINDIKRRYEHTYVFVEFPEDHRTLAGKEALFYVDSIEDSDSNVGNIALSSDEFGKIRLNIATDYTIKFKYPPVGVFQNEKQAYFYRRLPARQYSRGICQGNSQFGPITNALYPRREVLNFSTVGNAFLRKTYSLREALYMLAKGKHVSVALADNYSLSLSMSAYKEHILFYWDLPIALVSSEGRVTMVLEDAFRNEINKVVVQKQTEEVLPF